MKNKNPNRFDVAISIILLIATIASIILQVLLSSPTSTKLETSLFSILQFVFSLAFSWMLARISLRGEFQESQKRFAISAYRRIIEINNGVNRLINRTVSHMGTTEDGTSHELDVITEIGVGIRDSIRSSISDWADIIGDEIETVEKIQGIREKQNLESSESVPVVNWSEKQPEGEADVEKLIATLPTSLKITADDLRDDYMSRMNRGMAKLRREEKRRGYIKLQGFYEAPLERDIYDFKKGDTLVVRIGDDKASRIGALIAYDDENHSVGIITNKLIPIAASYFDAVDILFHYLRRSQFKIEILEIDKEEGDGRHYFNAKILDTACEEN